MGFHLVWIKEPQARKQVAEEILRGLPEWFGIEESLRNYVSECGGQAVLAALEGDRAVGFAALKVTAPKAAEIAVMGVLRSHQRKGIGKALFLELKDYAKKQGFALLQVKTVETGHYAEYDATNRFYQSMGFIALEVFPTLWDEWNPCQIYVLPL